MAVTTGYPTTTVNQTSTGAYRAYRILHFGFVLAPLIAGLDKYFEYLTNWTQYLAPVVTRYIQGALFMHIVGGVEIVAALLVLFIPRVGAYIVALWLLGIIANLILAGGYYDIALRDFGLFLGALALGQLAQYYKNRPATA
jgi:hypothetical protein